MVDRTSRIEGDGFLCADDGGIVLLSFVIGLGEQEKNLAVARVLRGSCLQQLRRFGVVAGFVGLVGSLQVVVVAHAVRGRLGAHSRREEKRGKERDSNRIRFGHGCSSHRYR